MRGVALVLVCLPLLAAGCAFEGQVTIQLFGSPPVLVKETTKIEFAPQRVEGTTTRAGQIIRIDCSVTGAFDVREATGSAVLVQTYAVHLRTRPLPRGTHYALDCAGPLILQLPIDASHFQATATGAAGLQTSLPVQAPLAVVPLAAGKKLRAESRTRFALVSQPPLAPGNYTVELGFLLPAAGTFRQKVVYAASVSCGARSTSSRSGRSSRRWRRCRRSRSSRPRTRPVSPPRTSLAESAATARRRARSRAPADRSMRFG